MNIAAGEAISSWARVKTIALVALATACVLLSVGYVHLAREVGTIRSNQEQAKITRTKMLELDAKILGQIRARSHPAS